MDLEAQEVRDGSGWTASFSIDPFRRDCLLKGLDDIGLNRAEGGQHPLRWPGRRPKTLRSTVDLEAQEVRDGTSGWTASFSIDQFRRDCLLNGLDDIGLTLTLESEIRPSSFGLSPRPGTGVLSYAPRDRGRGSGLVEDEQRRAGRSFERAFSGHRRGGESGAVRLGRGPRDPGLALLVMRALRHRSSRCTVSPRWSTSSFTGPSFATESGSSRTPRQDPAQERLDRVPPPTCAHISPECRVRSTILRLFWPCHSEKG